MKQLSPDEGFPTRLLMAALGRLFMLFLALLGLLLRTSVPAALPERTSADSSASVNERHQRVELQLQPGDTLANLLVRHGMEPPTIEALIYKIRPFLNARSLPAGQKVDLLIDPENDRVRGFEVVAHRQVVRADITADGLLVDRWALPFTSRPKVISGTVTDSIARSMLRAGLSSRHVAQLQHIFSADVNLRRDSRSGDAFAVVVTERIYADGQRSVESITAASLKIAGQYYSAFEYGESDGRPRYFDAQGVRLPHRFLAAPLDYDHISSTFDLARPDPITGKVRPHAGIDFVADKGTPVAAVGRGVVDFAGWHGGYGYLIEIDHGDGYRSAYGHLSSFGTNLRVGKHVQAGQVIGHVGATGYSTGPHLHFEFSRGEKKVDYLVARVSAGERLSGYELRRFLRARDERLASMHQRNLQVSQLRNLNFY